MKKRIMFFFVLALLFSCNDIKKLEGKYRLYSVNINGDEYFVSESPSSDNADNNKESDDKDKKKSVSGKYDKEFLEFMNTNRGSWYKIEYNKLYFISVQNGKDVWTNGYELKKESGNKYYIKYEDVVHYYIIEDGFLTVENGKVTIKFKKE